MTHIRQNNMTRNASISVPYSAKFTADKSAVVDYKNWHTTSDSNFSSETPGHINQLFQIINDTQENSIPKNILDMTAHVGGFSLPWAKLHPQDRVTSVEIYKEAFDALNYNRDYEGLSKQVNTVLADSVKYISKQPGGSYNFIYLDPPWGGPDYKHHSSLQLKLGSATVPDVLKIIVSRKLANFIFLKVPVNYDFESIKNFNPIITNINGPYSAQKGHADFELITIKCPSGSRKKVVKKPSIKKKTKSSKKK